MESPRVIKIMPYRGPNEEIIEGKKTKITFFTERLEYIVKYAQKVQVQSTTNEELVKEVLCYNEEEGFIMKEDVKGVVKYIETNYKEDLEAYNIHMLDICSSGTSITFSIDTEEDKNKLYQEIHEWKFGK